MLRIRYVNTGSWFLSIQDPGSSNSKKYEGEKFVVLPLFVATNHKTENYFIFEREKKKYEPI